MMNIITCTWHKLTDNWCKLLVACWTFYRYYQYLPGCYWKNVLLTVSWLSNFLVTYQSKMLPFMTLKRKSNTLGLCIHYALIKLFYYYSNWAVQGHSFQLISKSVCHFPNKNVKENQWFLLLKCKDLLLCSTKQDILRHHLRHCSLFN